MDDCSNLYEIDISIYKDKTTSEIYERKFGKS